MGVASGGGRRVGHNPDTALDRYGDVEKCSKENLKAELRLIISAIARPTHPSTAFKRGLVDLIKCKMDSKLAYKSIYTITKEDLGEHLDVFEFVLTDSFPISASVQAQIRLENARFSNLPETVDDWIDHIAAIIHRTTRNVDLLGVVLACRSQKELVYAFLNEYLLQIAGSESPFVFAGQGSVSSDTVIEQLALKFALPTDGTSLSQGEAVTAMAWQPPNASTLEDNPITPPWSAGALKPSSALADHIPRETSPSTRNGAAPIRRGYQKCSLQMPPPISFRVQSQRGASRNVTSLGTTMTNSPPAAKKRSREVDEGATI